MKATESKTFSCFLPFFSTLFLFTARDHSRDTNKPVKVLLLSTLREVQTWLRGQDPTFYRQGFEKWISRLDKCIKRRWVCGKIVKWS